MIPAALTKYLYHFHVDRDYFECHEILEEYWKEHTDQQKDSIWVGLILLAVANYHHRRKNFTGARKTLEKAIQILHTHQQELKSLGFNITELSELLDKHQLAINHSQPYFSYTLPIELNRLDLLNCYSQNEIDKIVWGKDSDLSNTHLVNRHKLRDRTDVINERLLAKNRREK
jgi:uncharacterized protein